MTHPRAGTRARPEDLVDLPHLVTSYYTTVPDPGDPAQAVAFGTSGHRGSSLRGSFTESHVLAMTQAICDYRRDRGIGGPLFLGRDTHGLSEPAWVSALEVLAANGVAVHVDAAGRYTPTPALSLAILRHNRGRAGDDPARADGIVVTPSHNPPADGGFKYNPPHGGPADTGATSWIAARANEILRAGEGRAAGVTRVAAARARAAATPHDFLGDYVRELPSILDLDAVRDAGVHLAADPLGGAAVDYWDAIAEHHRLTVTVLNPLVDATWRFMSLDHDGAIRMDCSSPYAMAPVVEAMTAGRDGSADPGPAVATGNDADADRHGVVTPDGGLMNPNHYLAVAIDHLVRHRPDWPAAAIGKTLVSSSMIDRVVAALDRPLLEVPVGFKWFVPGLLDSSVAFGGEESAGASFLRRNGAVWTTDKDGILLSLLAAEITATGGRSPSETYADLAARHGTPSYARSDVRANRAERQRLAQLGPEDVRAADLAGDPVVAVLSHAPGNGAPVGGIKVVGHESWFAARPSGTEDLYKVYAESFRGPEHLAQVQAAAREVVAAALTG
ncbi:MAG: phosphoglucomutase (alpha-D-glucose-1,6-bisphosphate-dependent) [Kineosporiaceae bacterium]